MTNFRRDHSPGATWFFTVALMRRHRNSLLVDQIDLLRSAVADVRARHPFRIQAWVVLPEHLHMLWTLPDGDAAIGLRWGLIKSRVSRQLPEGEARSDSRRGRGERGIWQRRFWEHRIRDEVDFERHCDYIHYNPVKHGLVARACDWPHSSFRRFVERGVYAMDWAADAHVSPDATGE
jgi:putative transposase